MTAALIYVRQSRHKTSERTVSPEVQRQSCLELPAVAACDSVEVIEDLDISGGKTKERRGYQRLLERVRAGSVAVVAAYDQSRAFRNTAAALEFYALLERHPAIEVVFVHGRFDRSAVGGFSYAVLAAAHEMERRMTGEKIAASYALRNSQGAKTGPVPLGYLRTGSRADSQVIIDEATAPLVRRVFEDYASGRWSTRELAHRLNAEGAIPAGRPEWKGDSIGDLLQNITYIARAWAGSKRHRRGEIIAGQWPRLIDDETWAAVQRQLARNVRRGGSKPAARKAREYVFSRLLICTCGRRLTCRTYHRPGYAYYRCRGNDEAGTCGAASVREPDLLPWGQEFFERVDALRPADFQAQVAGHRRSRSGRVSADAITSIDRMVERVKRLYVLGDFDEARYAAERDRLLDQRTQLMAARAQRPSMRLDGVLAAWNAGDPLTRRQLLTTLFDAIYVEGGQIVGVQPRQDRAAEVADLLDQLEAQPAGICSQSGEGGISIRSRYTIRVG